MNITDRIDHTILRADARTEEVRQYCSEAVECQFASVCVNTCHVPLAAELLRGSGVKVCCVVGFPLGAMSTRAKAYEAFTAVKEGAEEDRAKVKASGGIRTREQACRLIEAGADRIGAGNGLLLLEE